MKLGIDNKRGLSTSGFVIGLLVVLVLGGIIIISIYNTSKDVAGAYGTIKPDELQIMIDGCASVNAAAGWEYNYCEGFKSVKTTTGKEMWINCEYSEIKPYVEKSIQASGGKVPNKCADGRENKYCASLDAEGKLSSDTVVNGKTCESYGYSSKVELVPVGDGKITANTDNLITVKATQTSISGDVSDLPGASLTIVSSSAVLKKAATDTALLKSIQVPTEADGNAKFYVKSSSAVTLTVTADGRPKVSPKTISLTIKT